MSCMLDTLLQCGDDGGIASRDGKKSACLPDSLLYLVSGDFLRRRFVCYRFDLCIVTMRGVTMTGTFRVVAG